MLELLRKIKKLKIKELKKLEGKLEIIHQKKMNEWFKLVEDGEQPITPVVDFDDLRDALTYCEYHFTGARYDHELDTENCPCNCHCINCELIPTNDIGIKMQEMGKDITEENVIFDGLRKGHFKTVETGKDE